MFRSFESDITGIELPARLNNPFYYAPHRLCELAATELRACVNADEALAADAAGGKMMGVLVVKNKAGEIGYLAGFSGLLCGRNILPGFVPPVFDFLSPAGYFKREEGEISAINAQLSAIKGGEEYCEARLQAVEAEVAAEAAISERRAEYAANKAARAARRAAGALSADEAAELVRSSQFEKAELKRYAARQRAVACEKGAPLRLLDEKIFALTTERKQRSAALQEWLFTQFSVLNGRGEQRTLLQIFSEATGSLPPAGAGECAAPKMLQYAYKNSLQPLAMAEFWMGASPQGEVRRDGCFYGACKSKCYPILTYMLQGVDVEESALEEGGAVENIRIVYEDEALVVVEKPSGVLSVPGVVGGSSVQDWLRSTYGSNDIFVVHRLDMATSGLLVAARSMEVFKAMQAQFAERCVDKRYVALLCGVPQLCEGEINLPLMPDYDNRPRQKVDFVHGKPARTLYKVERTLFFEGKEFAVVSLVPVTGRTHQLRVHCASSQGLDTPIVGDALYGSHAARLMLHAEYIAFSHPVSGERMELCAPFTELIGGSL